MTERDRRMQAVTLALHDVKMPGVVYWKAGRAGDSAVLQEILLRHGTRLDEPHAAVISDLLGVRPTLEALAAADVWGGGQVLEWRLHRPRSRRTAFRDLLGP